MIYFKLFGPKNLVSEALFFPDIPNEREVIRFLKYSKHYLYVLSQLTKAAIYTITNDRLTRVLYTLHRKGIDVRIITDDETMDSLGCTIRDLANAGVPVRNDRNLNARMHHKFIVIDDEIMLNGSFNWTVQAVKYNNENVVVSSERAMVMKFKKVKKLCSVLIEKRR